jgi:chromosome partitioning protein
MDCPPSIGMLTANALVASDQVLMPLQAEYLPLKGVRSFMKTFKKIQKQVNPDLKVLGFLLTKFDGRKKMNKNIFEQLVEDFGNKVFKTKIRTNIALAQAQEWGVDIFTYDISSRGAYDYMQLAREFLKKLDQQ